MYNYTYSPNTKETRKSVGKTKTQITKLNSSILINTIFSTAKAKKKSFKNTDYARRNNE